MLNSMPWLFPYKRLRFSLPETTPLMMMHFQTDNTWDFPSRRPHHTPWEFAPRTSQFCTFVVPWLLRELAPGQPGTANLPFQSALHPRAQEKGTAPTDLWICRKVISADIKRAILVRSSPMTFFWHSIDGGERFHARPDPKLGGH